MRLVYQVPGWVQLHGELLFYLLLVLMTMKDTFMLGFWCMCVNHMLSWSVFLVVVGFLPCMSACWEVGGMRITVCVWRSETNSGICSSFRLQQVPYRMSQPPAVVSFETRTLMH